MDEENHKLRRQDVRRTKDLRLAHLIIDVQEKVAALSVHPIPEQDPEEESRWLPSPSWPSASFKSAMATKAGTPVVLLESRMPKCKYWQKNEGRSIRLLRFNIMFLRRRTTGRLL
jgi:hypothetical protein